MDIVDAVDVATVPAIGRAEAVPVATTENDRFTALLRALPADAWGRPTDCTRWTVRDVVAHVLGAAEGFVSPRELARQLRGAWAARPHGGMLAFVDALNEVQVRDRRDVPVAQLVERFATAGPRAARVRARLPGALRVIPVPFPQPIGRRDLAYGADRLYTHDIWMHRVDVGRAAGIAPTLTPEHDGRIVADIVAEWATTHDEPFDLVLGGPAGGRWRRGTATALHLDAVELVRLLSGRGVADGVLRHPFPL
jgi:uncharacterized protein (TIGR03083 family)